jgi:hypothetical protein
VKRGVSKAQDDADIPARHRADQRQDDDHGDGDEGQYHEESHFLGQPGRLCVAVVWLMRIRGLVIYLYHHHSLPQACRDYVTSMRRLCGGCVSQLLDIQHQHHPTGAGHDGAEEIGAPGAAWQRLDHCRLPAYHAICQQA